MPISEKDVFASLMQDPNHAYNPIEKVWAEAVQRARQFRNNEKALALAFDKSPALEKLFDYLDADEPLTKAIEEGSLEDKIKQNFQEWNGMINLISPYVRSYDRVPDNQPPYERLGEDESDLDPNDGWNAMEDLGVDEDELLSGVANWNISERGVHSFTRGRGMGVPNIFDTGYNMGEALKSLLLLKRMMEFDMSFSEGFQTMAENSGYEFANNEQKAAYINGSTQRLTSLFNNDGNLKDTFKDIATTWVQNAKVQEHHDMVVNSRGGDLGENPEPEALPYSEASQAVRDEQSQYDELDNFVRNNVRNLDEFKEDLGDLLPRGVTLEDVLRRGEGQQFSAVDARNVLSHALDMQGKTVEQKMDMRYAWDAMTDGQEDAWDAANPEFPEGDELQPEASINPTRQTTDDTINLVPPVNNDTSDDSTEDDLSEEEREADAERATFDGNVNEAYRKFTPRTLKGDEEESTELVPTVNGEEYNPFEKFDLNNSANIDTAIKDLVEEYARMHEANEEGTAHLGSENNHFPGAFQTRQRWEFNKGNFLPEHKLDYNALNANKAVIEEYLRVLFNAREGNMDGQGEASLLPWSDHADQSYRRDEHTRSLSWDGLMGEELSRGLEPNEFRMNTLPHPGAWDWYQLLNTASGLQAALGAGEDSYVDANGNPAFHLIPQQNLTRLGYRPDAAKLNSFLQAVETRALGEDEEHTGEEVGPGLRAIGFHLNEDDLAKFRIKRLQEANPGVYDEFSISGAGGTRNHFEEAWRVFQAGRSEQETEDGSVIPAQIPGNVDFLEWVGLSAGSNPDEALWRQIPQFSRDWQDTHWADAGATTGGTSTEEAAEEEVVETEEERLDREQAEEEARLAQVEADRVAEQERAEAEAERKAVREAKINSMIDTQKLLGDFEEGEEEEHRNHLNGLDDKAFDGQYTRHMEMRRKHRIDEKKQRDKAEADAAKEAAKPTGKPERTPAEFEQLKNNFKRVYERVHGRPVNEDAFNSWASNYETLDKEYQQALKVEHDRQNKEHQGMLESAANNIAGKDGIDPLPEPPTEDDLKHQIRQIENWKFQHGAYMTDKKAKETLQQLETEAYQKANNAGFDAEDFINNDKKEAKENDLDYGSAEWIKTVGAAHIKDQMKGARYRRQVQQGGELRANNNYKPWLVIQYDPNGSGHLMDLRSGQEIRREDLKFDKETPGFDYTGNNDLSQLADPESAFWDGLDYANLQPIRTDEEGGRSATQPPQIGHSPGRFGHRDTAHAWYHPESKSWINPHRYWDAREELGASAPGSGMLMLQGTGYHGKNQSGNRGQHYGFQYMGGGVEGLEHSYYLDGQGNIAHVNTDYDHGRVNPDFSQPQTVNSVIHDWHSDYMQQQMKANMGTWMEGGKPKDNIIISPQQQQGPTPLQNAVQVGDALHRRRQQGKLYGKRGFDRLSSDELGMEPTYYGKRGRMQMLTPRTATEKLKQGIVGTVGYTESGVLTGLAKLALNTVNIGTLGILGLGWGQEQNNIKRQRANYNRQAKVQEGVRQHMASVTDNGRQRAYLSPGEQQARIEDHKALKESLTTKQALAQNRARELRNSGDREGGARAEADSIRFQALKQGIDKRKIENPADWEHINALYEQHYGSPQVQATLAPAIGEQPSQNLADIFQQRQQQPQVEAQPEIETNWNSSPSQPREIEPNWS